MEKTVKDIALDVCDQYGYRLYDLFQDRSKLTIFIDQKNPNEGIGIDDCEKFSKTFSFLMSSFQPEFLKKFSIEISSPGIDRKLREPWHFKESVGKLVRVKTHSLISGKHHTKDSLNSSKSILGKLTQFSNDTLFIDGEIFSWKVPLKEICFARVVFQSEGGFKQKLNGKLATSQKSRIQDGDSKQKKLNEKEGVNHVN